MNYLKIKKDIFLILLLNFIIIRALDASSRYGESFDIASEKKLTGTLNNAELKALSPYAVKMINLPNEHFYNIVTNNVIKSSENVSSKVNCFLKREPETNKEKLSKRKFDKEVQIINVESDSEIVERVKMEKSEQNPNKPQKKRHKQSYMDLVNAAIEADPELASQNAAHISGRKYRWKWTRAGVNLLGRLKEEGYTNREIGEELEKLTGISYSGGALETKWREIQNNR